MGREGRMRDQERGPDEAFVRQIYRWLVPAWDIRPQGRESSEGIQEEAQGSREKGEIDDIRR
jgi:hypothetical protein